MSWAEDNMQPCPEEERDDEITSTEIISIKKETDKAWLMEMEQGHGWWLPKSRCTFNENDMVVEIPTWLYNKKLDEKYIEVH